MTVFTIPNDPQKYKYPDSGKDVTLGQYLTFLQDVMPQEPPIIREAAANSARLAELEAEIAPWAKKATAQPELFTKIDLAKLIVAYANDPQSPKKTRQLLPELAAQYLAAIEAQERYTGAMGPLWYAQEMLPYMGKVVSHFTGVPVERTKGMELRGLEFLYGKIVKACTPPEQYEYKRTYLFEGEVYELPEQEMRNSTVIEFAEAAQFQANTERLQNGHMLSLIDVISVILRRPGEAYSEEVYQRNRAQFARLPLADALEIAFFLMRQSERCVLNFVTSTTLPMGEKGLREVAQTLRRDTAGISHSRPLQRVVYSIGPTLRR
jgi:hypothetical protein